MVLFAEPSPRLTPLLEPGNFPGICLMSSARRGGRKANENVFPVPLLSCAFPCWSHVRKTIAPGWKGYVVLPCSRLQNDHTAQVLKPLLLLWLIYTESTAQILEENAKFAHWAFSRKLSAPHTVLLFLSHLERTWRPGITRSLCPVLWPAARSLGKVLWSVSGVGGHEVGLPSSHGAGHACYTQCCYCVCGNDHPASAGSSRVHACAVLGHPTYPLPKSCSQKR